MLPNTGRGEDDAVPADAQAAATVPVWSGPVPRGAGAPPLLWMVGVHGGAGATSLAASIGFAGDAAGRWPGHIGAAVDRDSPFVVLVARTHMSGLVAVHHAVLSHLHAGTPEGTHLLGVITVADSDRPVSKPVGARRTTVESLTRDVGGVPWRLGWLEPWRSLESHELPAWSPGDPTGARSRDPTRRVPAPVAVLAESVFTTARTAATRYRQQHSIPPKGNAAAG